LPPVEKLCPNVVRLGSLFYGTWGTTVGTGDFQKSKNKKSKIKIYFCKKIVRNEEGPRWNTGGQPGMGHRGP
jgi:hypothetical protein